jgi:hypothetical protein
MRTLCYVASPSFSGSTLLTFLLGSHPGIATVGELKGRLYNDLEVPRRCSCGRAVRECPFWLEVARRAAAAGVVCDLDDLDTYFHAPSNALLDALLRARLRGPLFEGLRDLAIRAVPGGSRELARLLERNRVLAEVICEIQGGRVLLDASKDELRLKFLIGSGLFDLRVLHLVRDGRGVANSFRKRSDFPIAKGAGSWRRAHEAFGRLIRELPREAVQLLRYEDLVAAPDRVLNDVYAFLGLPPHPLPRDFRAGEHHVFGNPMRLSSSSDIRLDESWRSELGPDDLAEFERIAGARNRAFGYEA